MEALILGTAWENAQWQMSLENANEHWRCACVYSADAAYYQLHAVAADVLIVCMGPETTALLSLLAQYPPITVPWIVTDGMEHPLADVRCSLTHAEALPDMIDTLIVSHTLPRLSQRRLPQLTELAADLLQHLDMQPRLGAWTFLPEMLAMCVMQPALMADLTRQLYPLCAQLHHLSAACVERRLRLAVESTWNRGSLDTLDACFGQTIDPQRGKPTNKEFLAGLRMILVQQAAHISVDQSAQ